MKTGLIVFGVIFLVLGGMLYFMPTQKAAATTTTVDEQGRDTQTSYATVEVPWPISVAFVVIGCLLLIIGIIPRDKVIVKEAPHSSHLVEKEEHVESKDGKSHKVVRERKEEV